MSHLTFSPPVYFATGGSDGSIKVFEMQTEGGEWTSGSSLIVQQISEFKDVDQAQVTSITWASPLVIFLLFSSRSSLCFEIVVFADESDDPIRQFASREQIKSESSIWTVDA